MNNVNFNKEDYAMLKDIAQETNTHIAQRKNESSFSRKYNGVTIAFKPMTQHKDNRMLAVAVSYCAPEDKFKKKIGKYQALYKLEDCQFIQVPLGQYFLYFGPDDTAYYLLEMFDIL